MSDDLPDDCIGVLNAKIDAENLGFTKPMIRLWIFGIQKPNMIMCCEHEHKHYHATFMCEDGADPEDALVMASVQPAELVRSAVEGFLSLSQEHRTLCEVTSPIGASPTVH